ENPWGKDGTGKDVDLHLYRCKKQTIVATSTIEAEYVAATSCCGQVM
nr:putative ribonuclease H-like domain-containing protein [Tanacetum cinerariifolium]